VQKLAWIFVKGSAFPMKAYFYDLRFYGHARPIGQILPDLDRGYNRRHQALRTHMKDSLLCRFGLKNL
jgi:hypothetical protein